jgi:thioredoxin-related protein
MIWSWYNSGVKQKLFFLFLVLATFLVGCKRDLTVDMSKAVVLDTNAPPVNLAAEITRAKTENKLLFLEFGSSDSCPPCVLMQQKVFSTPEFKAYEKSNLVFVRLDFPLKSELPPAVKATNSILTVQFDVYVFPTFIALNPDGKEFWRMPEKGNMDPEWDVKLFTPKGFIALIESVKAKEK